MRIAAVPLLPSRGGSLFNPIPERGEIALQESLQSLIRKPGIGKDVEEELCTEDAGVEMMGKTL